MNYANLTQQQRAAMLDTLPFFAPPPKDEDTPSPPSTPQPDSGGAPATPLRNPLAVEAQPLAQPRVKRAYRRKAPA